MPSIFCIKDQFWNTCMMRVTLIIDKDVALWKVCYNVQSQDVVNFHTKIVTSLVVTQYKTRNKAIDALVDINDGLQ